MPISVDIADLLQQFNLYPTSCEVKRLGGAGGFSGAKFWQFHAKGKLYCLRRWPQEHPDRSRLEFIHQALLHTQAANLGFVPVPIATATGNTVLAWRKHLWELTPWMPGKADFFPDAAAKKLGAAMKALAQFHAVLHDFSLPAKHAPSPVVQSRIDYLQKLTHGGELAQIYQAMQRKPANSRLMEIGREVIAGFQILATSTTQQLMRFAGKSFDLQPVIRDVWSDHILFIGEQVTGIIDFGAMSIDAPVVDIARLLGSMAGDDPSLRQHGLAAYQREYAPLSNQQLQLAEAIDAAAVILAGINWLRWILVEERQFEDFDAVLIRLDIICQRLRHRTDKFHDETE